MIRLPAKNKWKTVQMPKWLLVVSTTFQTPSHPGKLKLKITFSKYKIPATPPQKSKVCKSQLHSRTVRSRLTNTKYNNIKKVKKIKFKPNQSVRPKKLSKMLTEKIEENKIIINKTKN